MNEEAFDKEEIRHHVQLCDTATHKVFYDKLEFIPQFGIRNSA